MTRSCTTLGVDYRISLLRAAAFHGASHHAAQVFQVIVPKQIRSIVVGRQRIQFVYQAPDAFTKAKPNQAAGLNGAAQIVHDLDLKAVPRILEKAAAAYENPTARRLGYLLEHFGHARQAAALRPFARVAKSMKPLDPSVKQIAALGRVAGRGREAIPWKLTPQRTGGNRHVIPRAYVQTWSTTTPWRILGRWNKT